MTDLAAAALEGWCGLGSRENRSGLIEVMSGSLAFMMETFTMDDLPPEELARVQTAADALYALAPRRARMPGELLAAAREMHGERVVH